MFPANIMSIWYTAALTHVLPVKFCPIFDTEKERIKSNAVERKRGRLRSRFGGVVEQQIGILAVHFRH